MRDCCCCGCCCFDGSFIPFIPPSPPNPLLMPNGVELNADGAPVALAPKPPRLNGDIPLPALGALPNDVVVVVVVELKNDGVEPNPVPAPEPASVENIEARNGFAPPSIPVA